MLWRSVWCVIHPHSTKASQPHQQQSDNHTTTTNLMISFLEHSRTREWISKLRDDAKLQTERQALGETSDAIRYLSSLNQTSDR